ncbi:hypothetical protein EJ110_NYTH22112 [Nymphaea thermarum]|nr:hypothetical protein EJ110_NYTH22112 [Nymphaea thermarum]
MPLEQLYWVHQLAFSQVVMWTIQFVYQHMELYLVHGLGLGLCRLIGKGLGRSGQFV